MNIEIKKANDWINESDQKNVQLRQQLFDVGVSKQIVQQNLTTAEVNLKKERDATMKVNKDLCLARD